jgi:phenylpyruvate tautomerase PptA (4-oxalocrotonate tautomerase family)
MPLAKIHVVEGRYDEERLAKVSAAVQAALMNTLRVPPEDFYQLIFEFPKKRFLHTPSFVGMHYTDDLIILDLTFIEGRPKETRLALLKDVNSRVAAAAGISPDDLMITLYEAPGEISPLARARRSAPMRFRANRNHMPLDLSWSKPWPPQSSSTASTGRSTSTATPRCCGCCATCSA